MRPRDSVGLLWAFSLAGVVVLLGVWSALCREAQAANSQTSSPAVEKDVAYAEGGDQQKLDLYLPGKQMSATVVFTYGGGWHTGSRKSVTPIGQKIQALGLACALLSHRLAPKDKFPAQIEDVAAAFAWVKQHIAGRGGNPKKVFLAGHSSGAHLSLLLATDPKYLGKHKLTPADIAGVIGLTLPSISNQERMAEASETR